MSAAARRAPARGGPLVLLVLLTGGWTAARVMWWEHPFAPEASALGTTLAAQQPAMAQGNIAPPLRGKMRADEAGPARADRTVLPRSPAPAAPRAAAPGIIAAPASITTGLAPAYAPALAPSPAPSDGPAPFLAPRAAPLSAPAAARAGRWSLDAWAFWREGSDAAPVSQGRVPVYGASQAGAVLQYRLAPQRPRDPRLYARAYHALVRRGESELALGASLRPLARVPLRVAGEVRYTDGAFDNALRPAAYAVTELPPLRLPLGARLEAYGQAGWVGGPGATAFADGLAVITREVPQAARLSDNALHLSLGLAAWGGAQRDAQRVDVGPSLRLDMRIGKVPARLSVDWRKQVAGDAAPGSGVAATLSTGF